MRKIIFLMLTMVAVVSCQVNPYEIYDAPVEGELVDVEVAAGMPTAEFTRMSVDNGDEMNGTWAIGWENQDAVSGWASDGYLANFAMSTFTNNDNATFSGVGKSGSMRLVYPQITEQNSGELVLDLSSQSVDFTGSEQHNDFGGKAMYMISESFTVDNESTSVENVKMNHLLSYIELRVSSSLESVKSLQLLGATVTGLPNGATVAFSDLGLTEVEGAINIKVSGLDAIGTDSDSPTLIPFSIAPVALVAGDVITIELLFSDQSTATITKTIPDGGFNFKAGEHCYLSCDVVELTESTLYDAGSQAGDGSEGNPYIIDEVADLSHLSDMVNADTNYDGKFFVMTTNINLNGSADNGWSPIGRTNNLAFAGNFNGGGFEISGLYINSNSQKALFGYLDENGVVCNLGVSGDVTGYHAIGASQTAGLVANNYGFIINCYSEVNVTGQTNVGGIAAYNEGNVVNCYNRGSIKGGINVGGIVGQNPDGGYVGYCISTGEISGTDKVGGVVGWNHTDGDEAPTVKGSFCLNNTTYSIGLNAYKSATGGITGNVCGEEYLKSNVFAIIINNGAATYNTNKGNVHVESPIEACAWKDNSISDYPTLNFEVTPVYNDKVYDIIYNSGTYEIYSNYGLEVFAALVNGSADPSTTDYTIVTSGGDAHFNYGTAQASIKGKLMKDINLGGIDNSGSGIETAQWTPIGLSSSKLFNGTLDGANFKVNGIYIDKSGEDYQGLFGYLGADAVIKNLGVAGTIKGMNYVGGVAGYSEGSVTNCYNTVAVNGTGDYIGGVVGYSKGSVTNCYNIAIVNGTGDCVGGVVGYSEDSVTNCYNTVAVNGTRDYVGGVVGFSEGSVTTCYNTATVNGTGDCVGGVVGFSEGSVAYCYSLENCVTSGSGGVDGTEMTDEMMKKATFVVTLNDGACIYNILNTSATQACAWEAVTDSYPTLNFNVAPSEPTGE